MAEELRDSERRAQYNARILAPHQSTSSTTAFELAAQPFTMPFRQGASVYSDAPMHPLFDPEGFIEAWLMIIPELSLRDLRMLACINKSFSKSFTDLMYSFRVRFVKSMLEAYQKPQLAEAITSITNMPLEFLYLIKALEPYVNSNVVFIAKQSYARCSNQVLELISMSLGYKEIQSRLNVATTMALHANDSQLLTSIINALECIRINVEAAKNDTWLKINGEESNSKFKYIITNNSLDCLKIVHCNHFNIHTFLAQALSRLTKKSRAQERQARQACADYIVSKNGTINISVLNDFIMTRGKKTPDILNLIKKYQPEFNFSFTATDSINLFNLLFFQVAFIESSFTVSLFCYINKFTEIGKADDLLMNIITKSDCILYKGFQEKSDFILQFLTMLFVSGCFDTSGQVMPVFLKRVMSRNSQDRFENANETKSIYSYIRKIVHLFVLFDLLPNNRLDQLPQMLSAITHEEATSYSPAKNHQLPTEVIEDLASLAATPEIAQQLWKEFIDNNFKWDSEEARKKGLMAIYKNFCASKNLIMTSFMEETYPFLKSEMLALQPATSSGLNTELESSDTVYIQEEECNIYNSGEEPNRRKRDLSLFALAPSFWSTSSLSASTGPVSTSSENSQQLALLDTPFEEVDNNASKRLKTATGSSPLVLSSFFAELEGFANFTGIEERDSYNVG